MLRQLFIHLNDQKVEYISEKQHLVEHKTSAYPKIAWHDIQTVVKIAMISLSDLNRTVVNDQ